MKKISYLPFVIGLVGFLLVLVTGIFPRLWLISIGIEALLIGCTFLWMLMWADIAKAARMQVGELGAVCTLMSLALFGGGWWQIQYWQPDQAGEWGLPAGFAILISIWAVYSAARSGSRQAMARFLGALDRSPIGSRPTASSEVGMANSGTRQVVGSQVPDNHNAYDRTVRGRKGIKGDKLR